MDFIRPLQTVVPRVQGRILAVLAQTTAELNLRTIASIADVSEEQASRVLPRLVAIGLVERREAPPSALVRLVRDHIAAEPILALSRSRDRMIQKMREIAEGMPIAPTYVTIFGSFARGKADTDSEIDTLLVRPSGISESDDAWYTSVRQWIDRVGEVSRKRVEVLEVDEDDVPARLRSGRNVWQDIERDGLIIHGRAVDSFQSVSRGQGDQDPTGDHGPSA